MRRRDIILISVIAAAAIVWLLIIHFCHANGGSRAEVTVDGQVYGTYELSGDYTVEITQDGHITNTLHIADGCIYMELADCPDKLCVKQGRLTDTSRSIVCLPNRVVVTIIGEDGSDMDSTTY